MAAYRFGAVAHGLAFGGRKPDTAGAATVIPQQRQRIASHTFPQSRVQRKVLFGYPGEGCLAFGLESVRARQKLLALAGQGCMFRALGRLSGGQRFGGAAAGALQLFQRQHRLERPVLQRGQMPLERFDVRLEILQLLWVSHAAAIERALGSFELGPLTGHAQLGFLDGRLPSLQVGTGLLVSRPGGAHGRRAAQKSIDLRQPGVRPVDSQIKLLQAVEAGGAGHAWIIVCGAPGGYLPAIARSSPETYNSAMDRRERWIAVACASATALATLVPYLVAWRLAPQGTAFTGFLLNPIDGFSYLAKMRQGLDGSWLFHLPYAAEHGAGVFLYPYYLLLGHVAGVLRVQPIVVLHAARLVAASLMFVAVYRALEEFLPNRRWRWYAYGLCLIGGGWGWLAVPFGMVASDLSIPETTPFLSSYSNAHFPLATAAYLLATVAVLGRTVRRRRWWTASAACGAVLALVLPFVLLPAGAVLVTGVALLAGMERPANWWAGVRPRLPALVAFAAGAAPIAIYDAWILLTRPDLAKWTAQNSTPSPSPVAYLIGFAPLLLLGGWAFTLQARRRTSPWLLAGWAAVQLLLLYAPLALQRRLALGAFLPLAALAALGAAELTGRRGRLIALVIFITAVPSNLLVIAAGLGGVARGEPLLVQSDAEACASAWLDANAASDSLVLAGETHSNRLPAQAGVRVLYGHPFETPDAESERALVLSLYDDSTSLAAAIATLEGRGIDFVVYGPEERGLGPAAWPEQLRRVADCGDVGVFEVPAP